MVLKSKPSGEGDSTRTGDASPPDTASSAPEEISPPGAYDPREVLRERARAGPPGLEPGAGVFGTGEEVLTDSLGGVVDSTAFSPPPEETSD
jgi:hypothetical protein